MPHGLPVNGHHREALGRLVAGHESVEPVKEAGLKSDRIDFAQERSDAVSTGCFSSRQIEPCSQPFTFAAGPPGDGLGSFGSGKDGRDGDGDDVFNGMENVNGRTWIFDCPARISESLESFESNFHDGDFLQRKGCDSMQEF
jgi:hypothetical protein